MWSWTFSRSTPCGWVFLELRKRLCPAHGLHVPRVPEACPPYPPSPRCQALQSSFVQNSLRISIPTTDLPVCFDFKVPETREASCESRFQSTASKSQSPGVPSASWKRVVGRECPGVPRILATARGMLLGEWVDDSQARVRKIFCPAVHSQSRL